MNPAFIPLTDEQTLWNNLNKCRKYLLRLMLSWHHSIGVEFYSDKNNVLSFLSFDAIVTSFDRCRILLWQKQCFVLLVFWCRRIYAYNHHFTHEIQGPLTIVLFLMEAFPLGWWSEYVNPYIPTQTPEEDWTDHVQSPGWQPTLCVASCLICWFASL